MSIYFGYGFGGIILLFGLLAFVGLCIEFCSCMWEGRKFDMRNVE